MGFYLIFFLLILNGWKSVVSYPPPPPHPHAKGDKRRGHPPTISGKGGPKEGLIPPGYLS